MADRDSGHGSSPRDNGLNFEAEEARIRRAYARYDENHNEIAKRDHANRGNLNMERERDRELQRLLQSRRLIPIGNASALEVGCGTGSVLRRLVEMGADPHCLLGVDMLEQRISLARERNPGIRFETTRPDKLAFPDKQFDLVLAFTLFSSILDRGLAATLASEILRVLRPTGTVIWYDTRYPNPGNPDVTGISRSRLAELFPGCRLELRAITLLPPIARRVGRWPAGYALLSSVGVLKSRYLGLIRPPASTL